MKLRDHPSMNNHGVLNWLPVWTQSTRAGMITKTGEVGVLRHVHQYDGEAAKISLIIDHDGQPFVGTLLFSNVAFGEQLA